MSTGMPTHVCVMAERQDNTIELTFFVRFWEGDEFHRVFVGSAVMYADVLGAMILKDKHGIMLGSFKTIKDAVKVMKGSAFKGPLKEAELIRIMIDPSVFDGFKATYEDLTAGIEPTSVFDTIDHIEKVNALLKTISTKIRERGATHDASKLVEPELSVFDEYTPKLAAVTYGSNEYKEFLTGMAEGLKHHYGENRHHPEHFMDGVAGMTLVDLVEMACDWHAAAQRHDDGDPIRSCEINGKRFGLPPMLVSILKNTMKDLS